jgi:hypothetical protein
MFRLSKTQMKQFFALLILLSAVESYSATFDVDTIDNWQIYNGTALILSGNQVSFTPSYGTVKRTELNDFSIVYHHCTSSNYNFDVTIEITNEAGEVILSKRFKESTLKISKEELQTLKENSIVIRYCEEIKNGTDRILGKITFF